MLHPGDASKLRLGAMFFDHLLLFPILLLEGRALAASSTSVLALVISGTSFAYFFVQEGLWATTLGKLAFGLRVVKADGTPARWRESAIRTALRFLEVNPVLLGALPGGVLVIGTKNNQRLGDVLAGTVVLRKTDLVDDESQQVADAFS